MSITPIKTENDYRAALKKMELLFDASINTPESDEADILGLLIDEYEKNITRSKLLTQSKPLKYAWKKCN